MDWSWVYNLSDLRLKKLKKKRNSQVGLFFHTAVLKNLITCIDLFELVYSQSC